MQSLLLSMVFSLFLFILLFSLLFSFKIILGSLLVILDLYKPMQPDSFGNPAAKVRQILQTKSAKCRKADDELFQMQIKPNFLPFFAPTAESSAIYAHHPERLIAEPSEFFFLIKLIHNLGHQIKKASPINSVIVRLVPTVAIRFMIADILIPCPQNGHLGR